MSKPWHSSGLLCAGFLFALSACTAPSNVATPAAAASAASVQAHVDAASASAGTDLKALMVLCAPVPATRPTREESEQGITKLIGLPAPQPGKAFDNLYFVGAKWVSAWAIKTSDGIIIIDALNNRAEGAQLIEGGLRKLGMDPANIKYIIVTHGHGDHYGDAAYLAKTYGARMVMSALDWQMTASKLEFDSKSWDAPPQRDPSRDLAVGDGDSITLGDTRVAFYLTPGHTMGTLSPVFDVRHGKETHRVMEWGGTAFNFGKDMPRLDSYIGATERMRTLAQQQNVDVIISNHSGYDGSLEKMEQLRSQPAGSNPFVIGAAGVMRSLKTMGECARATRDRFAMQG